MRLADDDRARVPFALVGIVLLLGSATFAATMARQQMPADEPAVGPAIEKAQSSTHAGVARAVERAAREAGRNPVVEPVNTSYGRVLNDSTPFRDYLRVRIYLAVERALDDVEVREGDVVADPSVPDASNATALRDGKHRIVLEPVAESRSAGLRVRVRNVTITTSQDGRVLDRRTITPTVVVSTPVLALHERTERYETRLNQGPLDGPGLGRRLTARTYALAWVRGYARYGGTPIENVVANRHVELLTNGALLREQRRAFGHADTDGRRAMGRATAEVALTDLTAGSPLKGERWVEYLFDRADDAEPPIGVRALSNPDAPRAENTTVGVNRSADEAFSQFVDGGSPSMDSVLASVYSADVRLASSVRQTNGDAWTEGQLPPENWTLVDERTETTVQVGSAPVSNVTSPSGWDRYRSYSRTVVRTRTTTKRWRDGNRTRRRQHHRQGTYRVTIDVLGNPAPRAPGPSREITSLYERGGPLDGPNMRDVPRRAVARLVESRGGPDELARRAVEGSLDTGVETVHGRRPDGLSAWVYADLARLRERVGNVSVAVDRRSVATGRQRPAGLLGEKLRDRRVALVDAPERYGSVAERARVAARAAYLDRVDARLDERSRRSRSSRANVEAVLSRADLPSLDRIERISASGTATTPERSRLPVAGPDQEMAVSVDATPSYLTLAEVNANSLESSDRYHPLVARNVNVFTAPYGDVADEVVDGLFDGFDRRRVDLRTAARTLRAANRTLQQRDDDQLAADRDRLHADVDASMGLVRRRLASSLARDTPLDYRASRTAVDEGLARWNGTAARALAVSNGSAADPIATAVVERLPPEKRTDRRRDWIALRVRLDLTALARQERVRPPQPPTNRTASRTRTLARNAMATAVEDGLENATERAKRRWFGKALSAVPAGLPVTPIPGQWYATVNVWHVEVGGTYARFTVRAQHGSPTSGSVEYTRANRTVRVDVDGEPERFGRNERVSFRTETVVLVAVPPGGSGIGDVDGNADERSEGWSGG